MLIFIFQAIWLYIGDIAGKGLGFLIIGKFIFYMMPNLTEKVLPLTVLLSSILTFGTFAENYEFAAMKASGISLQRAMRTLIVFVLLLGIVTFFFANDIIPIAEHKRYNLTKNIGKLKPAAAITEGIFSDFEGMNIKVDDKYGENDRFLKDIIIHFKNTSMVTHRVIKADRGELISSKDSDLVQLVLKDGYFYDDVQTRNQKTKGKVPFAKGNFDTYTINIELTQMADTDLEKDRNVDTNKMKNIARLTKDIDSINNDNIKTINAFSKSISSRSGAFRTKRKRPKASEKGKKPKTGVSKSMLAQPDTLNLVSVNDSTKISANLLSLFNESKKMQVVAPAVKATSDILTSIKGKKKEIDIKYQRHNVHVLSLHSKYALALSCIILFFVGAPLGAIIRKGGLGLPMVIAIILFLAYYFLGVGFGNSAKAGKISPVLGAWIPTLVMLPLGVFLTKRATNDKGLITFGNLWDSIKSKFKKNKIENAVDGS